MTINELQKLKFLTKNQFYEHFSYFCSMKLLKQILNFYLDASVHVALAVFSLVQLTGLFFEEKLDAHLSYFLFFGTAACYNFIKYGVEAKKYILVANKYHKNIQFVSFIALGFAVYHAFFISLNVWIGIGVLCLLTGLYALPILPQAKNFRSLGGLKIFLVALVWAGATVILPMLAINADISWDVIVESCQRLILVFVLLLPFEIRDLKYDEPELKTIPQRFGAAKTKVFGYIATLILFGLTFFKDYYSNVEIIGKLLLLLVLLLFLYKTSKKQTKYFTALWVEAIPFFWWILVLILINHILN